MENGAHSGAGGGVLYYHRSVLESAQAVLFDLDNTLIDRDAAFARWLAALGADSKTVACAIELDAKGRAPREPLAALLDLDAIEDIGMGIAGELAVDSQVCDLVRDIADRCTVAVLTNGGGPTQRRKLEAAGLAELFGDRVFVSGELGVSKPDEQIFRHALSALGCEPTNAVMVGDDLARDIGGAFALSMRAIWLRRPGSGPTKDAPGDVDVITSLSELGGVAL